MARWSDSSSSVSIRRVHARRVFGSRSHNAPCARGEEAKEKGAYARCRSPCPLTSPGAVAAVVAVAVAAAAAADATVSAVYTARQPHANIYERIQGETE